MKNSKSKRNSKSKEPITLLEIVSNVDNTFEVRIAKVNKMSIPVLVGLLEKAKFDLLARDFEEDFQEVDELPGNFMNNKFDA
jgi:hypothetical protein